MAPVILWLNDGTGDAVTEWWDWWCCDWMMNVVILRLNGEISELSRVYSLTIFCVLRLCEFLSRRFGLQIELIHQGHSVIAGTASQMSLRALIHLRTWPCVTLRDPAWRYVILGDGTWSCVTLRKPVWRYVILRDGTLPCVKVRDPGWRYVILRDVTWSCVTVRDPAWRYMTLRDGKVSYVTERDPA